MQIHTDWNSLLLFFFASNLSVCVLATVRHLTMSSDSQNDQDDLLQTNEQTEITEVKHDANESKSECIIPKKLHIIYNPHSGAKQGQKIAAETFKFFDTHNIEYNAIKTEYGGHAIEIAQTVDFDGYDAICCIGGDGTAHETINGMMRREDGKKLPVGIIPAGTGNSLLVDFGMANDFKLSLNAIASGNLKTIDCGSVELLDVNGNDKQLYTINMIGLGMAIDGAITADDLRPCCCCCCCCGPAAAQCRYSLGALWHIIKGSVYAMDMKVDDEETQSVGFNAFFVMNNKHMGSAMQAAPNASLEDGRLDIMYARPLKRGALIELFNQMEKSTHLDNPEVISKQCVSLKIESKERLRVNIDGEMAGTTPLAVTAIPQAFKIYVVE